MPNHLKVIISMLVALVAGVAYYFEREVSTGHMPYLMLGLGAFMIFALWLFPEAGKKGK